MRTRLLLVTAVLARGALASAQPAAASSIAVPGVAATATPSTVLAPVQIAAPPAVPTVRLAATPLEVEAAEPATVDVAYVRVGASSVPFRRCATPCRVLLPPGRYELRGSWPDGRGSVARVALDPPGLRVRLRASSSVAGGVLLVVLGLGGVAAGVGLLAWSLDCNIGRSCPLLDAFVGGWFAFLAGGGLLAGGAVLAARNAHGGIESRTPLETASRVGILGPRVVAMPALVSESGLGLTAAGVF